MAKNFDTEIRETFDKKYLKVFLKDVSILGEVAEELKKLESVKTANVTNNTRPDITVYPKKFATIEEVQEDVVTKLESIINKPKKQYDRLDNKKILASIYSAFGCQCFTVQDLLFLSDFKGLSEAKVIICLNELSQKSYIVQILQDDNISYCLSSIGIEYIQKTSLENTIIVKDDQSHIENTFQDTYNGMENNKSEVKTPMVFISHSSKDKEFVEHLVDLLELIGLSEDNIFCSSIPGYDIKLSDNIFDTLRSLFHDYELYVLFIHSPRYYESPISLNEMGAAWVMRTKYCSILTKDMTFDKMDGVVTKDNISIKVDSVEAKSRLNALMDKLVLMFKLKPLNMNKWERHRNNFLKAVNALQYPPQDDGVALYKDLNDQLKNIEDLRDDTIINKNSKMPQFNNKLKVFISYSFKQIEDVENLKNLLVNNGVNVYFEENLSCNLINSSNSADIKSVLLQKISGSDVIICIAGVYSPYNDWMEWELSIAHRKNKPIIGVIPRGQEHISQVAQRYADIIVRWDMSSIEAAISHVCR